MRARLRTILTRIIFAVGTGANTIEPTVILTIPVDRFAQSRFPSFLWMPVERGFNQTGIDRITSIMARSIFNEANQCRRFSQRSEHTVRDIEVMLFIARADIVSRTCATVLEKGQDCPAVIV